MRTHCVISVHVSYWCWVHMVKDFDCLTILLMFSDFMNTGGILFVQFRVTFWLIGLTVSAPKHNYAKRCSLYN